MAETVTITVRHRLDRAETMRRLRERAEALKDENRLLIQNAHAEWGERMGLVRVTALAQTFTASIDVADDEVTLGIVLPPLAFALKDRIAAFFRRELRRTLRR